MATEEARIYMKECIERFKAAQTIEIDWKSILNKHVYSTIVQNSKSLRCSKELIIFPLLASIAHHMGSSTMVKISQEWSENIVIWNVVAARRGERKSMAVHRIVRANGSVIAVKKEGAEVGTQARTIIDSHGQLMQEMNKHDSRNNSRLIILDDVECCFDYAKTNSSIWNSAFLSKEYDGKTLSSDLKTNLISNFASTCQATVISKMLDSTDSTRLIDRIMVVCAPEVNLNEEPTDKVIPLETVLQAVRDAHEGRNVTYTFTTEGEAEFQRVVEKLHTLKLRYVDDEIRRGCINQSATHIARLCCVITALTNAVISPSSVATCCVIERELVRNVFLLTLLLMRQKFALLPHVVGISPDVDHCMLLYQSEMVTKDNSARNNEDVIEITLDGNDEPIARIVPRSEPSDMNFQITNVRTANSSDIMILRDGYAEAHSVDRSPESLKLEQSLHNNSYPNMSPSMRSPRMTGNQHQIHRRPMHQSMKRPPNNPQQSVHPRQPPPLKIRPNQIFLNRAKIVPPRRILERNKIQKNDIYTCSDELFIQQCGQKIKKCMLTHGVIITTSYACQYRLFPPVPLAQRTSSPRTTHPSWAAIKFFERLQKLGLGSVVVFRSQSVKFQKKSLAEMSPSTRHLLKTVGVGEEEFEEALNRSTGADAPTDPHCLKGFEYVFGANQDDPLKNAEVMEME